MGEYDPELGWKIHEHLVDKDKESPINFQRATSHTEGRRVSLENSFVNVMSLLGMDLEDDSLKDTPLRVARMYCEEIFTGLDYNKFPRCMTFRNTMGADEMVAVTEIAVRSMCEHHFMPFSGTATVAYLPSTKVLGTSKFNRIVDFFARRPQVQERLVEQILFALTFILETSDVAVVIKADHMCTRFRGVQDFHSAMVTSKLSGRFRSVDALRLEFLSLTKNGGPS